MMSDYHSYLVTSLDLHTIELDEFKYGGTNITAFRLVDPERPELQKVVNDWANNESRYGRKLESSSSGTTSNKVNIKQKKSLSRYISPECSLPF